MTPNEEMENALTPILGSMRMSGVSEEEITAYRNGFTTGAMWRNTHPHWISVEDELPEEVCHVLAIREGGLDMGVYAFLDKDCWESAPDYIACVDDISHWMPLPQPPKEGGEQ